MVAMAMPHGDEPMTMDTPPIVQSSSYSTHPEHSGLIMTHIALMTISWVFVLPIVVMLSIARYRRTFLAQLIFLALNALGVFFGIIYNRQTPDLYENNAHHKIGWIASCLVGAQAIVGLLQLYGGAWKPTVAIHDIQYERIQNSPPVSPYRYSRDSGTGTEPPNTPPLSSPADDGFEMATERYRRQAMDLDDEHEKYGLLWNNKIDQFLLQKTRMVTAGPIIRIIGVLYEIMDRTILIMGFIALCSGIVTYGGHFKGGMVFSGLAHFIKGGIFFWYGLLTLGRVMGSFADFGWAWNVKPPASIVGSKKARVPSAEFMESFLIFIYGAMNMWMEHLGSDDGSWSAGDLEHVSISIMFFGGGLCGMLVESKKIRELLNFSAKPASDIQAFGALESNWQTPKTYNLSTNPLPGIILLLLGIMMSSHHQESMVSTMLHKQWGNLFIAAALARGVTYILIYISPPTSYLPSRPPSEIVAAFCLISGGMLFMGSNSDFVLGMEMYGLHAMFLFTVMMGLTALLMAWEIVVLTLKGWIVQRQQTA